MSENPTILIQLEGYGSPVPPITIPMAILNAFCTLEMAFVDCSKNGVLKQMIAGKVIKNKNDCKESTYPESLKKAASLSAFLCKTAACKSSKTFPC